MKAAATPIARPTNIVSTATFSVPIEQKKTEAELDELVGFEVTCDDGKLGVLVGLVVLARKLVVICVATNIGEPN